MLLAGNFSLEYILAAMIVLVFGMGIHEYAHAFVADWWGDPTPRQLGRLTLNPLVHINWIGFVMFLILGFGVLGSVPTNPHKMRDPRWGKFWTAFAGPLSNLLQAIIFAIVWFLVVHVLGLRGSSSYLHRFLLTFLDLGIFLNVAAFVFNMLPLVIPGAAFGAGTYMPMDGWNVLFCLLPGSFISYKDMPNFIKQYAPPLARFLSQPAFTWQDWMPIMAFITMAIFLIGIALPPGWSPIWMLIGGPTYNITNFLKGF